MNDDRRTDEIARLAYDLWLAEGQPEGKSEEHWHRASALLETAPEQPEESARADPAAGDESIPADTSPQVEDVAQDGEPVGMPDDQVTDVTPKWQEAGLEHDAVRGRGDAVSDALLDDAVTGR